MKKEKNRIFILLLAVAMLLSSLPPAAVAESAYPEDISGQECEAYVQLLVDYGIIDLYPDGTFRPDNTITRAEAVRMLVAAGGYRLIEYDAYHVTGEGLTHKDVRDHWAFDYIVVSLVHGIFVGYSDAAFGPDDPITYNQLCTVLVRQLGFTEDALQGGYPEGYVAKARELSFLPDVDDFSANATRADFAIMLAKALDLNTYTVTDGVAVENGYTLLDGLKIRKIYDDSTVLRPFVLVGTFDDGTINAIPIEDGAATYVWDPSRNAFVPGETDADTIVYNFAAVCDTNGDGTGDAVFVVNRGDSEGFWSANMQYADPRAETDPAFVGGWTIPYGQRLIETANSYGFLGGAASDFYNLLTPGDLDSSVYYPTYDWFNTTSTKTLTYLTGFPTTQQSTGWACGVTAAIMAMEWYGLRGDLNELDLGALRNKVNASGAYVWGGYTDTQMLIDVFDNLNKMEGEAVWEWISTYDFVDEDGELSDDYLSTDWIKSMLAEGKPILIGWNSFGGHWQAIIGYDDMGTETTADDVLLLADPYDSTDHLNDGINIQSYERFYYDWTQNFDRDFSARNGYGCPVVFVPIPIGYAGYEPIMGDGLAVVTGSRLEAQGNITDDMLIPYGDTASDLAASGYTYAKAEAGENGLAGPASSDYFRTFDFMGSPYYYAYDFYGSDAADISDTLILLERFRTSQQASEWTCGPSSIRMVLDFFSDGTAKLPSEFALSGMRSNDVEGATTLDGMAEIFDALGGWEYVTTDDLDDDGYIGDFGLYDGYSDMGLIPYLLDNGVPIIIGWDEWGGHWQVIIGYDDMGTEETQDDVLILADPYDTTDHCQDGYVIESFERLVYGWGSLFDERGGEVFIIAAPIGTLSALGLMA